MPNRWKIGPVSYTHLNELENAKITLNNPDANQQEIDNAVTALTNAIANLQTIDATVNNCLLYTSRCV